MSKVNWYDPVAKAYREVTYDDAVLMLRSQGFTVTQAEAHLKTHRLGKPLPEVKKKRRGVFKLLGGN